MSLEKEKKREIIDKYKLHESDSGSPEVQIAIISERLNTLGRTAAEPLKLPEETRKRPVRKADRTARHQKIAIHDNS
jgi:hypothetical protein